MSLSRKVIILGNSGFIGKHLESFLLNQNTRNIVGKSLPEIDLTNWQTTKHLGVHFSPETSLIIAAAVKRQFGDNLDAFRQNMAIIENICRLLQNNPVKQVIFFSSAAVYGEETNNTNISEKTSVNPTSFYGIAKYSAERLLQKICIEQQIDSLICLRPPLIYGLGDPVKAYDLPGFCAATLASEIIALW